MTIVHDLKTTLLRNKARWSVNERMLHLPVAPTFRLGALPNPMRAAQVPAVDFQRVLSGPVNNPFVLARRRAHGLPQTMVAKPDLYIGSSQVLHPGMGGAAPGGAPLPTSVDWRDRWGWRWITTVRDQNGCEACWMFAAVALVEAMVRIEHCVWAWLSEGDGHKGFGAKCCDCGSAEGALDWIKGHSLADPGCFAWPVTGSGCSGCGGTGGAPYDNVAYTPTPDRSGRSVRIPAYTHVGSVADQKKWLDTVGPLTCVIDVYQDFFYLGAGVYQKQATIGGQPNTYAGGHVMLIVGYDDNLQCWIVKNSWGPGWGDHGYGRIGYGEVNIDSNAKAGLTGTNPDPWTKRRMHNGGMIESGNGATHRNFELLAPGPGGKLQHWWRDNSASGFPWAKASSFGNDVAAPPAFTSTTFDRNFESVHLTTSKRLHHWWFSQSAGTWNDGGVFGPTDCAGVPGFIQGDYGAPGNFEVVVRTADSKLLHLWRDGAGWHEGARFGSDVAFSGPSLVQGHYGVRPNFELVCVLSSGTMQHWWRDNDHGMEWRSSAEFGAGVASPPCMIEGSYGANDEQSPGNFELCVAVGGQVEHWWRSVTDMLWRKSAVFGHDVSSVVSLVEGSFGFNLEVIVLRTDKKLQHYWRDGAGWHEGAVFGSTQ